MSTLPRDLAWLRSVGDGWEEEPLDEAALARRKARLADVVPPVFPWRLRRLIGAADDDDAFAGRVLRRVTRADTAPDPYSLPRRRHLAGEGTEFDGLAQRRTVRSATDPIPLPPTVRFARGGRPPADDDVTPFPGFAYRLARVLSETLPVVLPPPRSQVWIPEALEGDLWEGRSLRWLTRPDTAPDPTSLPRPVHLRGEDSEFDGGARLWPTATGPRFRLAPPIAVRMPARIVSVSLDDINGVPSESLCPPLRLPPRSPSTLGADSLSFWLSGAATAGGAQTNPHASLGGHRSSTEATRVGIFSENPIAGLAIDFASRMNGTGGGGGGGSVGTITADGFSGVSYTAPGAGGGGTRGPKVRLDAVGVSRTVADGSDPSQWVRLRRIAPASSVPLVGSAAVEFIDQFENLFGFAEAPNALTIAGGSRYRACYVQAREAIFSAKAWVGTLGPVATAAGGLAGGASAGSVVAAPYALDAWPWRGWARIETAAGTLREIVYYAYRDHQSFFVLPTGRGRLGTAASAGAPGDKLYPVPGLRIAWEGAGGGGVGAVQTIASESTAPISLSWSTAITAASGIAIGSLAAGRGGALWLHRELPALALGQAEMANRIELEWTHEGTLFRETLAGLYRMAYSGHAGYELHVGTDAPPDTSQPANEYFPSLPFTYPAGAPLAPGHTYFFATNYRNQYDLVTEVTPPTQITIAPGGAQQSARPSAPVDVAIAAAPAGGIRFRATYWYDVDGTLAADQWAVWATNDGTDPTPDVDPPLFVLDMAKTDGAAKLDYTFEGLPDGLLIRAVMRTFRSSDSVYSASSPLVAATTDAVGPAAPASRHYWRRRAQGN